MQCDSSNAEPGRKISPSSWGRHLIELASSRQIRDAIHANLHRLSGVDTRCQLPDARVGPLRSRTRAQLAAATQGCCRLRTAPKQRSPQQAATRLAARSGSTIASEQRASECSLRRIPAPQLGEPAPLRSGNISAALQPNFKAAPRRRQNDNTARAKRGRVVEKTVPFLFLIPLCRLGSRPFRAELDCAEDRRANLRAATCP